MELCLFLKERDENNNPIEVKKRYNFTTIIDAFSAFFYRYSLNIRLIIVKKFFKEALKLKNSNKNHRIKQNVGSIEVKDEYDHKICSISFKKNIGLTILNDRNEFDKLKAIIYQLDVITNESREKFSDIEAILISAQR